VIPHSAGGESRLLEKRCQGVRRRGHTVHFGNQQAAFPLLRADRPACVGFAPSHGDLADRGADCPGDDRAVGLLFRQENHDLRIALSQVRRERAIH
jgi:hypothetical protein